jgi:hypothetical protein
MQAHRHEGAIAVYTGKVLLFCPSPFCCQNIHAFVSVAIQIPSIVPSTAFDKLKIPFDLVIPNIPDSLV